MEKNKEPRINLCFNLNDQRQKIVYDFLRGIKREKTSVVTDIILQQIQQENHSLDSLSQKIDVLLEKVNEGNQGIAKIAGKIEGGFYAETPRESVVSTGQVSEETDDEISDEAFSDMMALMY